MPSAALTIVGLASLQPDRLNLNLVNRYSGPLGLGSFFGQVHAGYVMFWALLSPCYYWSEMGGMFHGPAQSVEKARGLTTKTDPSVLFRVEDWHTQESEHGAS